MYFSLSTAPPPKKNNKNLEMHIVPPGHILYVSGIDKYNIHIQQLLLEQIINQQRLKQILVHVLVRI